MKSFVTESVFANNRQSWYIICDSSRDLPGPTVWAEHCWGRIPRGPPPTRYCDRISNTVGIIEPSFYTSELVFFSSQGLIIARLLFVYQQVGRVLTLSIVQGRPRPRCWRPPVVPSEHCITSTLLYDIVKRLELTLTYSELCMSCPSLNVRYPNIYDFIDRR